MIKYRKGDLFENAPPNAILTHAVNGVGKWGSGIAAEFARRYPNAYVLYTYTCERNLAEGKQAGYGFLIDADHTRIGCLVTSHLYGAKKDSPEKILEQTRIALKEFLQLRDIVDSTEIHSPRINAGLFAVPWEDTAKVIEEELRVCGKNIKWVVWEL